MGVHRRESVACTGIIENRDVCVVGADELRIRGDSVNVFV